MALRAGSEIELQVKFKLDSAEQLLNKYDKNCIALTNSALKLSESANYEQGIAQAKMLLGTAYKNFGFYDLAISYLDVSLKLFEKIGNQADIAENLRSLGEAYRAAANRKLSIAVLKKALGIFTIINDRAGLARTYNRLAAVYYELYYEEPKENIDRIKILADTVQFYLNSSDDISKAIELKDIIISNYTILGGFHSFFTGNDSSLYYLNIGLDLCVKYNSYSDYPLLLMNISRIQLYKKDYKATLETIQKALEMSEKNNVIIYKKLCFETMYFCYRAMGQYEKAFNCADSVRNLENTLFSQDLNTKSSIIQSNYENEKKSDLLLAEKQRTIYTIVAASFILVFLSIIILILRKTNKKQFSINEELADLNNKLNEKKEELEIANHTKDKFFSIIAHDLRSPFNALLLLTSTLRTEYEELTKDELKEYIIGVDDTAKNISKLLGNLLEWSHIQRGKITFNPENIQLKLVTDQSIEIVRQQCEAKDIQLEHNVPDNLYVFADLNMVFTIMRNLISNAGKFTKRGGKITVSAMEADKFIKIEIKDSGIGMSQEKILKLFKIDEKISTLGTENEPSTGLGLILCHEFITKNNGSILVTSEEGIGTTFAVLLPKVEG